MKSGIYQITNNLTGCRYIGSARHIQNRWTMHRRHLDGMKHHSKYLQRSWHTHGRDAFDFSVLLYCDPHNLLMYEQKALDAFNPEYNSAPVAGSMLGFKFADESKAKMSLAAKRTKNFSGHKHTQETKDSISAKKMGHVQSREQVEKRKASILLRPYPPAPRKLLLSDIPQIRDLLRYGMTQMWVADAYGVSGSVVCEIKSRKAYGWMP